MIIVFRKHVTKILLKFTGVGQERVVIDVSTFD